jgi:hypothetical protein
MDHLGLGQLLDQRPLKGCQLLIHAPIGLDHCPGAQGLAKEILTQLTHTKRPLLIADVARLLLSLFIHPQLIAGM